MKVRRAFMINNIKIGDKLQIHCYKHNGKLHQLCNEAIVLDIDEDKIVVANNKAKLTESDGRSYHAKEAAILFFYKKHWFNIIGQLKEYGLFYYCNIATPYLIDGNIIKYIDYDLDLRVFPDGGFKVLDYNEYNYHRKLMHYSSEIQMIIKNELSRLIEMKRNNEGPFQHGIIKKYYDLYKKMEKIQ
ncbi:MAG: DUF402 domain-containing protein [Bacilli bacterium]|nr:DUF402 domain-containing protein [Bacilli bacterium]